MARRARASHSLRDGTFELQLTSMVDMFTIILIFLVSSYSMSSVQISAADKMKLPVSDTANDPVEGLKLVVAKHGIYVDDQKIVNLEDGKLSPKDLDSDDGQFIRPLFTELEKQAQKTKNIAQKNETIKFDGKVVMQADEGLNYGLLKKVMYTSTIAGYADMKMATISTK